MGQKLIGEFLTELAEDVDKLRAYLGEDRDDLLRGSGLSDEQQEILRSNDLKRIRDAIRAEYSGAQILFVPLGLQNLTVPQNITAPQNLTAPPEDDDEG